MRSIRAMPSARRPTTRVVAFVATLLGCKGELAAPIPAEHGSDALPRRGGTLHLASIADIRGLDPAGPVDAIAGQALHLIFAGLVDFDDQGRVVADLADHWELDDAGTSYRFVLREGVRMQDGEELTAADVKRSVERALHPSTPDADASYFDGIAGYAAYAAGRSEHLEGVVVESRYVVVFRLRQADATFLSVLALLAPRPVCKTGGDRYVDTWLPCGAGPFKLLAGRWQRGTSLRLERHDGYFRPGLPYLDAVEWTFNMQPLGQRFAFERGELDLLRDMSQSDQTRFARDARWTPFGSHDADTSVYGEAMNTTMPPFDNVEVRRAVAAAIDREHYRLLKPGYVTPLTQPIPPDIPDHAPDLPCQRYDYAAALEHMRRAGLAYDPVTGRGGWPKPIDYVLYDKGLPVWTAQILQQDLAKVGLRLELRLMSFPAFLAIRQRPGGAAMSLGTWSMDYPDPSSFLEPLFTSGAIGTESTSNTAFYSNPRFDDLVSRAHRELDGEQRRSLYREASAILCDDAPWAFTFSYHWFNQLQPYVRGPVLNAVWIVDPTRTWLDRADSAADRKLETRDGSDR
jgi:ABC-type transport system substrate-binding protein